MLRDGSPELGEEGGHTEHVDPALDRTVRPLPRGRCHPYVCPDWTPRPRTVTITGGGSRTPDRRFGAALGPAALTFAGSLGAVIRAPRPRVDSRCCLAPRPHRQRVRISARCAARPPPRRALLLAIASVRDGGQAGGRPAGAPSGGAFPGRLVFGGLVLLHLADRIGPIPGPSIRVASWRSGPSGRRGVRLGVRGAGCTTERA
jgi:hypothetical protein